MSVPAATAWTAPAASSSCHDGHHRPGRGEGQSEVCELRTSQCMAPCQWHRDASGTCAFLLSLLWALQVIPGMPGRPKCRLVEQKPAWPRGCSATPRRAAPAPGITRRAGRGRRRNGAIAFSFKRKRQTYASRLYPDSHGTARARHVPSRQLLGLLRRKWSALCQRRELLLQFALPCVYFLRPRAPTCTG